jgi:HEAT repeat protein
MWEMWEPQRTPGDWTYTRAMTSEDLTDASGADLVASALAIDDEDDHQYWDLVRELQRRGDASTFQVARDLCAQPSEPARVLGINILAQLGFSAGRPFLEETLPVAVQLADSAQSPRMLIAAISALGHLRDPRGLQHCIRYVKHPNADVRFEVAQSLPHVVDESTAEGVVSALVQLMVDSSSDVRDWATFGLGSLLEVDTTEVRDALFARLDDTDGDTAGEALVGLAMRKDPRAADHIIRQLARSDAGNLIVEAAARLGDSRCLPALYKLRENRWDADDPRGEWLAWAITACEGDGPGFQASGTARRSMP